MSDIFISYAREDLDRAQKLAKALEREGWSVFWDRTIPAGKTWREVIGKALAEAHCIVVTWSKTSIQSSWVIEEADEGRERGILVPVLLDAVKPPIGFRNLQAADLINWDAKPTAPAFQKLVSDITAILGTRPIASQDEERRRAEAEAARKDQEEGRRQAEAQAAPKPREVWYGRKIAGIWLGCAVAFIYLSLVLFDTNNIRWFGMRDALSGVFFGSLVALGSGLYLARKQWGQLTGVAVYWLGCAVALSALSAVLFGAFGMFGASSVGFDASLLVALGSGLYLARKQWGRLTGVELAVYWLGCAVALVVLSGVMLGGLVGTIGGSVVFWHFRKRARPAAPPPP